MASENGAYSQFENTPSAHFGAKMASSNDQDKVLKKWKNSKRLCWGLLGTSIATLVLEIIGSIISGVHLDWFLIRFLAGIWLAALGVISSGLGLRAFRNVYESSKCWTLSHFVMNIISTIAYGIVFLMAVGDVYRTRIALETIHDYVDDISEVTDSPDTSLNVTMAIDSNVTTSTIDYEAEAVPIFNALKGNMAVGVFIMACSIAFFIMSIIASVIICRHWCRKGQKTMTIVYMPQDQSGHPQSQSVVVPSKGQVVIMPQKSAVTDPPQTHTNHYT